jgi:hypothetical protein
VFFAHLFEIAMPLIHGDLWKRTQWFSHGENPGEEQPQREGGKLQLLWNLNPSA